MQKEGNCVPELNPELNDHGLGRRQIQDAGSSKQQRCPNKHAHTQSSHTTPAHHRGRSPTSTSSTVCCYGVRSCQVPFGPFDGLGLRTWSMTCPQNPAAECVLFEDVLLDKSQRDIPLNKIPVAMLEIGGSPGHTNAYARMGSSPFEVVLG